MVVVLVLFRRSCRLPFRNPRANAEKLPKSTPSTPNLAQNLTIPVKIYPEGALMGDGPASILPDSECEMKSGASYRRVAAEIAPSAVAAVGSAPDGIELFGERHDEGGIVGQQAVFEVAFALALCAHSRACEVRRS